MRVVGMMDSRRLDVSDCGRVDGHWREIVPRGIVRPYLIVVGVGNSMVAGNSRRWSRSASLRNVYYQSFTNCLAGGIFGVEGCANGLLGAKYPINCGILIGRIPCEELQCDVWGVYALAERVCIFVKDDIADVIDEVVLVDRDSGSRGSRTFYPYFPLHCVANLIAGTLGIRRRRDQMYRGGFAGNERIIVVVVKVFKLSMRMSIACI